MRGRREAASLGPAGYVLAACWSHQLSVFSRGGQAVAQAPADVGVGALGAEHCRHVVEVGSRANLDPHGATLPAGLCSGNRRQLRRRGPCAALDGSRPHWSGAGHHALLMDSRRADTSAARMGEQRSLPSPRSSGTRRTRFQWKGFARQYTGRAGSSVGVAPIRAAAESLPRLTGTTALAAASP